MPIELRRARTIDFIARRYGALPSQVIHEDAELLRMVNLLAEAGDLDDGNIRLF